VHRFCLFACALSAAVAMAAPARADDDKPLRFVPHADLTIIDPYFSGVYITRTRLAGEPKSRRSVTNIGTRPTFSGTALTVETHLLNFSGEIAPSRIELRFWKRLRSERKFSGPEELRAQIARDIRSANRFFTILRKFRVLRLSD